MTSVYSLAGAECFPRHSVASVTLPTRNIPKGVNMKAIKVLPVMLSLAVVTLFSVSGTYAQDKDAKAAPATKAATPTNVRIENDKVRITEARFKPGEGGPMMERPGRASYAIQGGTFLRTYPDGKKVTVEAKTGEWRWLEKDTYSFVNSGKTEIVQHSVVPK
jgi:hypothetical protein